MDGTHLTIKRYHPPSQLCASSQHQSFTQRNGSVQHRERAVHPRIKWAWCSSVSRRVVCGNGVPSARPVCNPIGHAIGCEALPVVDRQQSGCGPPLAQLAGPCSHSGTLCGSPGQIDSTVTASDQLAGTAARHSSTHVAIRVSCRLANAVGMRHTARSVESRFGNRS